MPSVQTKIVLGCLLLLLGGRAAADEARRLLDRAIQAHGGEERLSKTKIGRLTAKVDGASVGSGTFKVTWEEVFDLPRRYKRTIDGEFGGQTFHREITVNGPKGWFRQGQAAPQPFAVTDPLAIEQHWHAVLAQLLLLRNKDNRFTLLGEEQQGGRSLVGIQVSGAQGKANLYFDKSTGLLARARRPMPNLLAGGEMIGETVYEDYREVGGVQYPMHLRSSNRDSSILNIRISSVEFLDKLDARVFAKPEATHAPQGALADKPPERGTETAREGPAEPNAERPTRWDTWLIAATLGGGAIIGAVWFFVRVSRRRSQQTPSP